MMKPKSESGLGIDSYQTVGFKIDQAIVDLCALLYDDKDAPRLVSVEYFYYLLWALLYATAQAASTFPWYDDILHCRYNGTTPASEYLDFVQRRQITEGRMLGAQAHDRQVADEQGIPLFRHGNPMFPQTEYAEMKRRMHPHGCNTTGKLPIVDAITDSDKPLSM
jgi:hypothetical protein